MPQAIPVVGRPLFGLGTEGGSGLGHELKIRADIIGQCILRSFGQSFRISPCFDHPIATNCPSVSSSNNRSSREQIPLSWLPLILRHVLEDGTHGGINLEVTLLKM